MDAAVISEQEEIGFSRMLGWSKTNNISECCTSRWPKPSFISFFCVCVCHLLQRKRKREGEMIKTSIKIEMAGCGGRSSDITGIPRIRLHSFRQSGFVYRMMIPGLCTAQKTSFVCTHPAEEIAAAVPIIKKEETSTSKADDEQSYMSSGRPLTEPSFLAQQSRPSTVRLSMY